MNKVKHRNIKDCNVNTFYPERKFGPQYMKYCDFKD